MLRFSNPRPFAFTLCLLLVAPVARASELVKTGSPLSINLSTSNTSQPDLALAPDGSGWVAYQEDTLTSRLVTLPAAGSGDPVVDQEVASTGFTEPIVVAPPSGEDVARIYYSTNAGQVQTRGLSALGALGANTDLGTTRNGRFDLFGTLAQPLRGENTIYREYTAWPDEQSEGDEVIIFTCWRVTDAGVVLEESVRELSIHEFHEAAKGVRMTSAPGSRGAGTQPSFLLVELANDAPAGSNLYGRFFDDQLQSIGTEFVVNPPAFDGFKVSFDVATNASGISMVVWEELTFGRQPVFALVDDEGLIPGSASFVSDTVTASQSRPDVVAVGNEFVVTWRREGFNNMPDTIQARNIDVTLPTAAVFGPELQVSSAADVGGRFEPSIDALSAGNLAIVWAERASDLSRTDIVGQRLQLADPIFGDGFESGDLAAWSGSQR